MLNSDKLKLRILKLLQDKPMTLGQLKRATKVAHHYTLLNAIEFLEEIGLVRMEDKGDKLNSKIVKRTGRESTPDFGFV